MNSSVLYFDLSCSCLESHPVNPGVWTHFGSRFAAAASLDFIFLVADILYILVPRSECNQFCLDSSSKKLSYGVSNDRTTRLFFYPAGHMLEQYCTREALETLGEKPENADAIASIAACVFGVNLAHPAGQKIAERWYNAAKQETPFFSPRPEQNALSVIVHQLGLKNWESPISLAWEEPNLMKQPNFLSMGNPYSDRTNKKESTLFRKELRIIK